jgi:4-hydroxybenzoate polyprenyltransferase
VTTFGALLRLARISNLPTIWSNVLAASVLAGGMPSSSLVLVLVAMSAFYAGGMFLNDVYDREIDARERPERPLPSGAVTPGTVWMIGSALLALGVALLGMFGTASAFAGLALAAGIVVYDAWHKGNALSPLIMGLCRALVYVGTALAAGTALSLSILAAALALLAYVIALTELAKRGFESVGLLIAGIALLDAVIAVAGGSMPVAAVCVACFGLTLALQRIVPGT